MTGGMPAAAARVAVIAAVASAMVDNRPRGPAEIFTDVTRASGLAFTYETGADGALHLPELMGPGAALFGFDNDGDLDVYFVQAGRLDVSGAPARATRTDRL